MTKCPHCGSTKGVYKNYTGVQYYTWYGAPMGYSEDATEKQKSFAKCIDCNRRISFKSLTEQD